jgi:hypothetical protein
MKAIIRWLFFVVLAASAFVLAWRVIMPGPFEWLSWRPWVGWTIIWLGCEVYAKRSAPNKQLHEGRVP